MTIRRILVCGLLCAGLAGAVPAAPGDVLYDSMASGEKQPGLAVLEGTSADTLVFVSYVNMDAIAGLSDGDTVLRSRTVRVRPNDETPLGYATPSGAVPMRVRR